MDSDDTQLGNPLPARVDGSGHADTRAMDLMQASVYPSEPRTRRTVGVITWLALIVLTLTTAAGAVEGWRLNQSTQTWHKRYNSQGAVIVTAAQTTKALDAEVTAAKANAATWQSRAQSDAGTILSIQTRLTKATSNDLGVINAAGNVAYDDSILASRLQSCADDTATFVNEATSAVSFGDEITSRLQIDGDSASEECNSALDANNGLETDIGLLP